MTSKPLSSLATVAIVAMEPCHCCNSDLTQDYKHYIGQHILCTECKEQNFAMWLENTPELRDTWTSAEFWERMKLQFKAQLQVHLDTHCWCMQRQADRREASPTKKKTDSSPLKRKLDDMSEDQDMEGEQQ